MAIIFTVFIIGLTFTNEETLTYIRHKQTYRYLVKNITLLFGVDYRLPGVFEHVPYKNAVNGSLWTLPHELKMYLCLGFIGSFLLYFKKPDSYNTTVKTVFISITTLAIAANIINHFQLYATGRFIHLFSMFFFGSALFVCKDNIPLSSRSYYIIILILLFSLYNKEMFFFVYVLSLPYIVIYTAYIPKGVIRKFNNFGDYSYGIYIYAFPVQQSIAATFSGVSVFVMIFSSFTITLFFAFLSWHLIEKKCLKMKRKHTYLEKLLKKNHLHPEKTLSFFSIGSRFVSGRIL